MDDPSDPTDAEIEDELRLTPAPAWTALSAAMADVEQGQDPDAVERLLGAIHGAGLVVPFDWTAWEGVAAYRGGRGLDAAPAADAVRLVTAILRADRFSEGTIDAALADGTLLAALHRLRRWREDDTGTTGGGQAG